MGPSKAWRTFLASRDMAFLPGPDSWLAHYARCLELGFIRFLDLRSVPVGQSELVENTYLFQDIWR